MKKIKLPEYLIQILLIMFGVFLGMLVTEVAGTEAHGIAPDNGVCRGSPAARDAARL